MQPQTFKNQKIFKIELDKEKYLEIVMFKSQKEMLKATGHKKGTFGSFLSTYDVDCTNCSLTKEDCHFGDKDKKRFGIVFIYDEFGSYLQVIIHELVHVMTAYFDELMRFETEQNKWKKFVEGQEAQSYFIQNILRQFMFQLEKSNDKEKREHDRMTQKFHNLIKINHEKKEEENNS